MHDIASTDQARPWGRASGAVAPGPRARLSSPLLVRAPIYSFFSPTLASSLRRQACPQWPLRTPTPGPQLVLGVNGLAEVVVLGSKIRNLLVRILLAKSQQPC